MTDTIQRQKQQATQLENRWENEYERDLYFGGEIYEDAAYEMHKMHMKNVRRDSNAGPPM